MQMKHAMRLVMKHAMRLVMKHAMKHAMRLVMMTCYDFLTKELLLLEVFEFFY
jgi:hypothetical protein